MITIDVVIPSFRLTPETLLPILNLGKPENTDIKFYLVADNPAIIPHESIARLVDNKHVFLTINKTNEGASATRNKGIDSGNGDWILFLDDDIAVEPNLLSAYANAIRDHTGEIGFIGVVNLPPEETTFEQAVIANGSMDMFTIAKNKTSYAWGVTANFMVSRKAIGSTRFSHAYPKTGGGEDVEFFIRVREINGFKDYKCLDTADVTHPWWKNGKPDFKRFYRYGKGISYLPQRNPRYRSYDFMNASETLLAGFFIFIIGILSGAKTAGLLLFPYFIVLTLLLEYIIGLRIVLKNKKKLSPAVAFDVMLLRYSSDIGVLWGNMARFRLWGLGERFNFNGRAKHYYFALNTNKIIKLVVYLLAACYAMFIYRY